MFAQHLKDRTLIKISGDDAESFLENLVTCRVVDLATAEAAHGALLTPQGKILFDFLLSRQDDGFVADIRSEIASEFVKRLAFYKLRAKVEIAEQEEASIFAVWDVGDDDVPPEALKDTRHLEMGYRVFNKPEEAAEASYDAHRVELGIAEGGTDFAYGNAYPHEVLMDQFAGVDLKKGCFVGQEVVSRMQHRGSARKRIIKVSAREDLPPPGTPVTSNGKPIGQLGSAIGKNGLALLRLDRAASALHSGESLLAGETAITATIPGWVNFDWPEVSDRNA